MDFSFYRDSDLLNTRILNVGTVTRWVGRVLVPKSLTGYTHGCLVVYFRCARDRKIHEDERFVG